MDNASRFPVGQLALSPVGQRIAHHYAHRMRLNWRITTVRQKVLYIVLGSATIALFFLALRTLLLDGRSWPYAAIGLLINLTYTLLGVRTFRGHLEPAAPPRPWWRWTGRPKAGYWLGSLNLLGGYGVIQDFWPHRGLTPDLPACGHHERAALPHHFVWVFQLLIQASAIPRALVTEETRDPPPSVIGT